jgi:type I restriction enzyme, S subunit
MTDQNRNKKALTPRLRFPEFNGGPGWETTPLDELAEFVSDRISTGRVTLANYVSTENILPDFGGMTNAAKLPSTNGIAKFIVDDILVSNIRPYLKKVWQADRAGGASNDVIVIRPKREHLKRYLPVVLKSDAFISYVMKTAKGVKMPRGDISSIEKYPVYHPNESEQRKIAACLASLDELLAAEGRKIKALRTHKKGLMQQLFPSPGESTPRLRFPEFRDAGEWEERKAGTLFANRKTKGEDGLPIYSVTINDGMVRRDSFERDFGDIEDAAGNKKACRNDISYNMMRMWQGACGVAPEDCLVSPAYVVLSPLDGVNSTFFKHFFKLPTSLSLLESYSRGLTKDRLRLYFEDFEKMPLLAPGEAEQNRIADCLSSLDALIATVSRKLDGLQTHKKGLMQQLFPSAEEG